MSTELQKNLAQNIVKNLKRKKPLNKKELVVSSGYDMTTAEKQIPAVFEQKGVQDELKILGFNEENAKKVVSEILLSDKVEPRTRLTAADMTFKVHGTYAPERTQTTNINIDITPKSLEIAKKYEEELKNTL